MRVSEQYKTVTRRWEEEKGKGNSVRKERIHSLLFCIFVFYKDIHNTLNVRRLTTAKLNTQLVKKTCKAKKRSNKREKSTGRKRKEREQRMKKKGGVRRKDKR